MKKSIWIIVAVAAAMLSIGASIKYTELYIGGTSNAGYAAGGTSILAGDIQTADDLTVDGDADLGTLVLDTPLAVAEGGTASATAADARTALGLAIGTNVQAYDADLAAIAAANSAANTMIYYSDVATANTAPITAAARGLLDDAATSNMRATLDLEPGTDVQAYDAQLADLAGLAVTDGNFAVGDGANWVAENGATARTSLGLGTIATQAASAIAVTGGTMSGVTITTGTSGKACDAAAVLLANQLRSTLTDPRLILLWQRWTLVTVSTPDDFYRVIELSGSANPVYLASASWTQTTHQVAVGNMWTANCGGARYGLIQDAATMSFASPAATDVPVSFAAWVYLSGESNYALVSRGVAAARDYSFAITAALKPRLSLQEVSTTDYIRKTADASLGTGWKFVVATYDGTEGHAGITLYADGVAIAGTGAAGGTYAGMENTGGNIGIGADNAGGSIFDGAIAAIIVDADEWTAGEVLELYYMTAPLIEAL